MIFSISKHMYERVLLGDKTLTTRVRTSAHLRKGVTWVIVPKRAKPAWWFRFEDGHGIIEPDPRGYCTEVYGDTSNIRVFSSAGINRLMIYDLGFVQAAIVIDDFWTCPLQEMTDAEAADDCGVVGATVADYMLLWDSINGRTKGARWQDNPVVTRIRLHAAEPVAAAVARIGRTAVLNAADAYRKGGA